MAFLIILGFSIVIYLLYKSNQPSINRNISAPPFSSRELERFIEKLFHDTIKRKVKDIPQNQRNSPYIFPLLLTDIINDYAEFLHTNIFSMPQFNSSLSNQEIHNIIDDVHKKINKEYFEQ